MSSFATVARRYAVTIIRILHLEKIAGQVHRAISPLARRNYRDDLQLKLLISSALREDSNCIDVGAHSGDILEHIVHCAPAGNHIAVEPLPDQAKELAKKFPQVDVHQAALAAEAGETQFVHVTSNPQLSGLKSRGFEGELTDTIDVKLERLDDIVDPETPITFIKVDVEGAEMGVFEGAARTLKRWKPLLAFEHGVGGADHFGTSSEQIHDLLSGYGYRIFDIDGSGPYSRADFAALFREPIWFFFART